LSKIEGGAKASTAPTVGRRGPRHLHLDQSAVSGGWGTVVTLKPSGPRRRCRALMRSRQASVEPHPSWLRW